jgi:hypothetical protein
MRISEKRGFRMWNGFVWLRTGYNVDILNKVINPEDSMKVVDFVTYWVTPTFSRKSLYRGVNEMFSNV